MQREIEALLVAYMEEKQKETKLVQDLLTALAVGAAARQRMCEAIEAASLSAVGAGSAVGSKSVEHQSVPMPVEDDLERALVQLRRSRDSNFTH